MTVVDKLINERHRRFELLQSTDKKAWMCLGVGLVDRDRPLLVLNRGVGANGSWQSRESERSREVGIDVDDRNSEARVCFQTEGTDGCQ